MKNPTQCFLGCLEYLNAMFCCDSEQFTPEKRQEYTDLLKECWKKGDFTSFLFKLDGLAASGINERTLQVAERCKKYIENIHSGG